MSNSASTQFMTSIENNRGIIYKLLGLYIDDKEEQKDVYQEILYQSWKSWPTYRKESKFSTWLYKISLNTILTRLRKKSPETSNAHMEEAASKYTINPWQSEDAKQLYFAIKSLNEADRALITLHLDGYKNPEIAEIMGIGSNHVGVKLHRIKEQLKKIMTHE